MDHRDGSVCDVWMFPVEICEIHSLVRYSREVFINRCSSAYRTPEMDTREMEESRRPTKCGIGSSSRLIAVTV